jgi:PAS domain S-box-containing protein
MSNKNAQMLSRMAYFKGGGEMGSLIRAYDWSNSILGSPDTWSTSLLIVIQIILSSRFPMLIWWGPDLIQFYNDAYRGTLGNNGKHPQALGQKGADCWPEIWQLTKPLIDQVINGGESIWREDELIPIYRNGMLENVYWTFSYSKIDDETANSIGGVLVVCNETTEKVLASQQLIVSNENQNDLNLKHSQLVNKLVESDARYRDVVQQAPVAIGTLRGKDHILELANEKVLSLWGKSNDILNKPIIVGLPEIEGQPFLQLLNEVYKTGIAFYGNEVLAKLNHGDELKDFYFNFVYHPIKATTGETTGIMVIGVDITEMVIAKHKVQESEARMWTFLNAIPQIAWMSSTSGSVEFYNKSWYDYTGVTFEDSKEWRWKNIVHPDDLELMLQSYRDILKSNQLGEFELRLKHLSGEYRWHLTRLKPILNADNVVQQWIGTTTDIQDLKMAQQRKDDFISIASHELKTPVTSLKASLQLLDRMKNDLTGKMVVNLIAHANKSMEKVSTLIDDLLNMGRIDNTEAPLNKSRFNVSELLKFCCSHIRVEGQYELIFTGDTQLEIDADEHRIDQVVINFVNNAIKYASNSKIINICVEQLGESVKVSVQDQGPGIPAEKLPHLFDRYYQVNDTATNTAGLGLGLGLYICADIIKRHGGEIGVDSEIGKGSTFWFTLPI